MTFSYALSDLVLPPTSLIFLTIVGALLARRRRVLGWTVMLGAQLALLVFSLPVVANALARSLEPPPVTTMHLKRAQAIVILAGGNNRGSPEWGGETVKTYTLQRLRYGARLARATGLPIYVSGGRPEGGKFAEATLMRDVLVQEYKLEVRWVDLTATHHRRECVCRGKGPEGRRIDARRIGNRRDPHAALAPGVRSGRTRGDRLPDGLRGPTSV